jgi:hypothetical protein
MIITIHSMFEGQALMRRLMRLGLLAENENKLDFVLSLSVEKFLDRRLQTRVFEAGLAKSIHHARVLIKQRHIRYAHTHTHLFSFPTPSCASGSCDCFNSPYAFVRSRFSAVPTTAIHFCRRRV